MVAVKKKIVKKVKGKSIKRGVKKKNLNRGKKINTIKADILFKEIIGSGESSINDLYLRLSELADSLNVIEKGSSDDCDSHELMQFIRMIKRSVEETQIKAGKLQEGQEALINEKLGDYVCIPVEAKSRLSNEELSKIGTSFSRDDCSEHSAPERWWRWATIAHDKITEIINDREISAPATRQLKEAQANCVNIMNSLYAYCNSLREKTIPGRRVFNEKEV